MQKLASELHAAHRMPRMKGHSWLDAKMSLGYEIFQASDYSIPDSKTGSPSLHNALVHSTVKLGGATR